MTSKRESRPATGLAAATVLNPSPPDVLQWDMQPIQLAVARRAYELFQTRNGEHGHDWEDWFQAESELLRPVSTTVSESAERISIRVNVFGFEADEIKVSIEPTRIAILGQRKMRPSAPQGPSVLSADFYPDQILRLIDISSAVDPDSAVVELRSGILIFELTKTAKREAKVPAVA